MSYDSQINQCSNDIYAYRNLRNKLGIISSNLSVASNNSSDIDGRLSIYYQVNDGESKISDRARNLSRNIDATNSKITGKVIPAIDAKINSLKGQIRDLERAKEREEEEERRRREEED